MNDGLVKNQSQKRNLVGFVCGTQFGWTTVQFLSSHDCEVPAVKQSLEKSMETKSLLLS